MKEGTRSVWRLSQVEEEAKEEKTAGGVAYGLAGGVES